MGTAVMTRELLGKEIEKLEVIEETYEDLDNFFKRSLRGRVSLANILLGEDSLLLDSILGVQDEIYLTKLETLCLYLRGLGLYRAYEGYVRSAIKEVKRGSKTFPNYRIAYYSTLKVLAFV